MNIALIVLLVVVMVAAVLVVIYQRRDADKRLQEVRQEADKRVEEVRTEAEKRLREVREDADKRVEETRLNAQQAGREALEAQQRVFRQTIDEMKASVNATTQKMLTESRNDFSEQSTKRLDEILTPFRDKLKEMRESMEAGKVSQTELRTSLEEQIKLLLQQTRLTAESADELARALTHDPKYQGNWGERECEQLLESQGLRRGYEYDTQVDIRYKDEQGKERIFRPDFVLHLDKDRDVIVDAKVSLTAFKDYCAAEDEATRSEALQRHLASMEKHVAELSDKDYAAYLNAGRTMNFVIMYVPITGALWTALKLKPELWRKSMERHVYIADEQTLFAALSIIRMTWTRVTQLKHQEEVYALATEMVKRVGMFYSHFRTVGLALDKVHDEYRQACDKLENKGNSIIVTANQLIRLGAKAGKEKYALPELTDNPENIEN